MSEENKNTAVSFLKLASSGNVTEAYTQFVGAGFRHHNPYFAGSAEALQAGMEKNASQNPNKVLDVKRVIAEGDFVVTHSHVQQKPDDLGAAVVHIFRFEHGKIVELWDLGQPVPEKALNENGMFYRRKDIMRKVIFFNLISLDGYFEGPDRDINWHNVDEEFNEFAIQQTGEFGVLLFGRVTYELMASYWPTEAAKRDDKIIAGLMNSLPKIVFSKTLEKADWENTKLVKDNFVKEVQELKQQPGKDVAIFGSSDLAVTFLEHDLIDEFWIMVNPIVLGAGKPLFWGIKSRLDLRLIKTRTFKSGNILLYYEPKG